MNEVDVQHLHRCVELAAEAFEAGDDPFGSLLVGADGSVLLEARNQVGSGDATRHPEFEIARWAAEHLDPHARAAATVYTSGEHCAMCAAAHGWVGLGRICYAHSAAQLASWRAEANLPAGAVLPLPITDLMPGAQVEGPADELAPWLHELHRRAMSRAPADRTEL